MDRYFSEKSMMEILGVDRDENAHSNFLAWLFENEVTGKKACQLLIELLNNKFDTLTDVEQKKGLQTIKTLKKTNIYKIRVIREEFVSDHYNNKDKEIKRSENDDEPVITGRSDLLIVINDGEAYIMIENKIDSEEICEWDSNKDTPKEKIQKEGKSDEQKKDGSKQKEKYTPGAGSLWQTQFYYNYYSNQKDLKDKIVFAFLTRSEDGIPDPVCKEHFFHLTYQEILTSVLEPISNKNVYIPECNHYQQIMLKIKDYTRALGISYTQDNIMAVETRLQDIVTTLLDENEELFARLKKPQKEEERKDLIKCFWNSSVYNTPIRDIIRSVLEVLKVLKNEKYKDYPTKNKKGDATSYDICNNDNGLTKNGLFKWLVSQYIQINKNKHTIEHLQRIFPPSLHTKKTSSRTNNVTNNHIIRNDFKDESKIWKIANVSNNHNIYVYQTGWDGPAMMSRLIRYVKTLKEFENIVILEIPLFLKKSKMSN